MKKHSFLRGTFILTLAGLISKMLGVFYRIPLARLVGSEGIGLYQMAYPVYMMILAVSTAGLPVAISVLVAEKAAQGKFFECRRIFHLAVSISFVTGLVMSLLLYNGAFFIAGRVLHEPRAFLSIVAISPAIFLVTIMASLRGYFQGLNMMLPTALSQVAEQTIRVATVLGAAIWLMPYGLEYAAAGAAFGAVTGGAAGLLLLGGIYCWDKSFKRAGAFIGWEQLNARQENFWALLSRLGVYALPVSFGALVLPVTQVIDAFIVPRRLQEAGYAAAEATALFGELSGMAATLVNVPTIITVALATSLVPVVAGAFARDQTFLIHRCLNSSLRLAVIICLPAVVGLMLLAEPLMVLLYDTPEAGVPLLFLAPSVLFLGIQQATTGILQGLGRTYIPVFNLLIGTLLKIFFNYYFTVIPVLGIRGPGLATVICFAVASVLNCLWIKYLLKIRYDWLGTLFKPGITATIMAMSVIFIYQWIYFITDSVAASAAVVVPVGALVYGVILFLIGGISRQELELIPRFGPAVALLLQKFGILRR